MNLHTCAVAPIAPALLLALIPATSAFASDLVLSASKLPLDARSAATPGADYVVLDLSGVSASARAHVNGERIGIRIAPPWTVDISKQIKDGDNQIEVLVCNALANQNLTVPALYRWKATSGPVGPTRLEFTLPKVLKAL